MYIIKKIAKIKLFALLIHSYSNLMHLSILLEVIW